MVLLKKQSNCCIAAVDGCCRKSTDEHAVSNLDCHFDCDNVLEVFDFRYNYALIFPLANTQIVNLVVENKAVRLAETVADSIGKIWIPLTEAMQSKIIGNQLRFHLASGAFADFLLFGTIGLRTLKSPLFEPYPFQLLTCEPDTDEVGNFIVVESIGVDAVDRHGRAP